jgi:TRAP-type C4-dicarboxylate transport system permease small subunit
MNLDLRLPIGLMFSIFGVMLVGWGLVSGEALHAQTFGINVNLWWGLVLLAFGGLMLAFAFRAAQRRHAEHERSP